VSRRIAVILGGRSSENAISLASAASVVDALERSGNEVVTIEIARNGQWQLNPSNRLLQAPSNAADAGQPPQPASNSLLQAGSGELERLPGKAVASVLTDVDVVFPVLHGPFGEDGTVQGLLEILDVPYAGPNVLSAAVAMDKLVFKRLCAFHGFPQVGFCEAGEEGWRERAAALGTPLWVKPSRLGSSVGISRVDDLADLDRAVAEAAAHDPRVIVEQHAGGREVECSVIGNDEPEASVPGEVRPRGDWYDFDSKYAEGGMELVVPAPIPDEARERVRELALAAYRAIGNTGLARCDFFVDEADEVLLNELNTIPGFTETSVFGKLFEASGVSYPELCDRLVRLAVERHQRERGYRY
jgi:D-alanine-D-alanine ligase